MTIGSETIPEYSFGGVHAETHSQAIGPDHSGIQRLFSDFFQSEFLTPIIFTPKIIKAPRNPIHSYLCYHIALFDELSFQGSDPRAATCRGKLQSKRSKLNLEINKELMLRSGAENLFK